MKWYFEILSTLFFITFISFADIKQKIQVDACLDQGGQWDHDLQRCVERNQIASSNLDAKKYDHISTRFSPPQGYKRTQDDNHSFQYFLRNLKLKHKGSEVKYFDGSVKPNHNLYSAVVDLDIGQKDLHQCADAIIRLRAEYLWESGQYDKIHFNFTNGFKVEYKEWMLGKRMVVEGNKTFWNNRIAYSNEYDDLWDYLELIFTYAGTSSLEKEMVSIKVEQAEIGDVLIQGGFPGHAVIIVDKVTNLESNHSLFLLAQSYMPAQELQILMNPSDEKSSWYDLNADVIDTPEWRFFVNDLKRFEN